jgi:ABC-type transport system involved in cytochrome bd biosynthesis fused ATPase/permease subunit
MFTAILLAAVIALLWFMRRDNIDLGKKEAAKEAALKVFDEVQLSKKAREDLRSQHDGDAARELRDKYTRDE